MSRTRPEFGPLNQRPRPTGIMHPDQGWHLSHWYEAPREDPAQPEVYVYTDDLSYAPGDTVVFRASSTAPRFSLEIWRDGMQPACVHAADDIAGEFTPMPARAYREGCGWPEAHRWTVPADAPSGFYRVASWCQRADGSRFLQHHFFVVRPAAGQAKAPGRLLFLLSTATWTAYNDWGGANAYDGVDGPEGRDFSPVLSLQRPWTRGLVWLPPGAPRLCDPLPREPWEAPRYPTKEWAYTNGYAQYYASSGWAQFERHFALWAEREGYAFDMITQTDLHYRPALLQAYDTVVIAGHDEYWTRQMRETIDRFVEEGGAVARFGGNFMWQIRLEDQGRRQVCYKARAKDEDPVRGGADHAYLTGAWEEQAVNWPGATTFGVNGMRGVYSSWGGFAPRASRGFTIYRPRHWAFAGLDVHYGDVMGAQAGIFAYEVDGLEYTFRHGLPYPTHEDGAPANAEILAMSPALYGEEMHDGEGFRYYLKDGGLARKAEALSGDASPASIARHQYGSGMIVSFTRGRGEVFTAGSCEWVMGLTRNCYYTQGVTRNVLARFLGRGRAAPAAR
ncbi:N,N-dimethylformamidase beta subunit family domain-containing protein [Bordetella hinzii]|uniref:N,N-dimethylformamidase beta subunit family domain-containing protein n=1 Tax=Bordetella hinzii TaxID=103855 RepID=UPI0039FCB917